MAKDHRNLDVIGYSSNDEWNQKEVISNIKMRCFFQERKPADLQWNNQWIVWFVLGILLV